MDGHPIHLPDDLRRGPVHVLLYTLIPADRSCVPIRRGYAARIRNRLRRVLDLAVWRVFGRWNAHYSTFKDSINTNRGDIAVRLAVKKHLLEAFGDQTVCFTELAWGELHIARRLSPPPHLVVLAGGGFLFADHAGRLPPRFAADLEALAGMNCHVVATSIGFNSLITDGKTRQLQFHPDCRPDVARFLAQLSAGSVRDSTTQRALAMEGLAHLPVIVDPAFLLAEPEAAAAKDNKVLKVALNIAFHATQTSEASSRVLPLMLRVLKKLRRETACQFTYFVHSDAERGIAQALKQAGIQLEVIHTDVDGMLTAYRGMDILVCQMLHSAILATSVGLPTLNLAYDVKSTGFFELLGLPHLCMDMRASSEADVFTAAIRLIADRNAISHHLRARRRILEDESRDFYAQVAALLEPDTESELRLASGEGAR